MTKHDHPGDISVFDRLAELPDAALTSVDDLITQVLNTLLESLAVGLVFLSRLDGDALHIVRVQDRAGMGMAVGDVIPLCDSY